MPLKILAATALAAATAASASVPLAFDRAQIGMSLSEWRSLPPPPGVGPATMPTCAPVTGVGPPRAALLGARTTPAELTRCSYETRFGEYVLPHTIRLDDRYRASGVQYLFASGRLAEIRYTASIDAFNDLDAMFTERYGAPARVLRDKVSSPIGPLERVREIWLTPQGSIFLTDPASGDDVQIDVRMVAKDAPSLLAS
jgi:hypothetical protein